MRAKLAARGARGLLSIGRTFRSFDDNGDQALDAYEITKALNNFRVGLSKD